MGVAGKYDLTIGEGERARMSTLEIALRGTTLEGALAGESGTTPLTGVASEQDAFELTGKAKRGVMRITMCLTGSVDGDRVAGRMDLGKLGSTPFVGVRAT